MVIRGWPLAGLFTYGCPRVGYERLGKILAKASLNLNDHQLALSNYKWLMNNWEVQQKLRWNDAMWELQMLFSRNLQFDNAISANQRLYRETGDDKAIFFTVLNARAMYCIPITQAYKLAYSSFGNNISNFTLNMVPHFITGAYTINSNTKAVTTLVKNGNQTDISKVKVSDYITYPAIVFDDMKKVFYAVNRLGDNTYFIISINSAISTIEENMISSIIGDKTNQVKWDRLIESNTRAGAKFFSIFVTRIMQNDYQTKGKISSELYWNSIKQNKNILYMVEHDKDGIVARYNFNKQNGNYEDIHWNKSSKTLTYFELEILYKNKKILDLTNPIINKGKWERSIRLGILVE